MKLNHTQSIDFSSDETITVVVPCTPDSDIVSVLNNLTNNSLVGAERISSEFDPSKEEVSTIFHKKGRIDLVGVKEETLGACKQALHTYAVKNKIGERPMLYLEHFQDRPSYALLLEGAVNGLGLASYNTGLYKSADSAKKEGVLSLYATNISEEAERGAATAMTQKEILGLVNAPSNRKNPETLANWARKSGERYGYSVTVLDETQLEDQGFHSLLAVNRGSEHPARFIICDYNSDPGRDLPVLALVGKGVTFDTGGISIKPSNHMHLMKSDMGGAAAVLGAVELIAKMRLPIRVVGFVPATDNSVDAKAIKPGDVISSYSGKTIEVINTDAEGRLILADALAYAVKNYEPDHLIDLATLTGSVVRALGTHCAGLFTHNDSLASKLSTAGDKSGERLWRLPLWEDYAEEMRSDIADLKNLSDKPMAGAITAAKFLENFVEDHASWAHLDIAGTAFKANGVSRNHTATAFGVRLLFEFAKDLSAT